VTEPSSLRRCWSTTFVSATRNV